MRLHINIDHVGTLRNARGTPYPDPVEAARVCLAAGAHGITAHLREDRRHIVDDDIAPLRAIPTIFNFEIGATDEMIAIATRTRPDVVTLVPERPDERTTEGGLDVIANASALRPHIEALRAAKIKVSLFVAAEPKQIDAARALGVEQIELHTGDYAEAFGPGAPALAEGAMPDRAKRELERLTVAAKHGHDIGLEIAAGHGLTTRNVVALVRIPEIIELNIGHAVISDSVFLSLDGAVKAMLAAIEEGRPS